MADRAVLAVFNNSTCTKDSDCSNITQSVCDTAKNLCHCIGEYTVAVQEALLCTRPSELNTTCNYEAECLGKDAFSTCDKALKICACVPGYEIRQFTNVGSNCSPLLKGGKAPGKVDPAMIGVLAGLILMFVIICVVLRLFSKARFRENRSIFNTPNPRLMNASLFKDSKLLSPARGGERRGSRASCKGTGSRAGSVTSVATGARRLSNTSACPKG